MNFFDALTLGVLQGLTEFLPVSSSGHLIVAEHALGLAVDQLQSFDVAVHFGTLLAIFVYFRRDFAVLLKTLVRVCMRKKEDPSNVRMLQFLIVGTVPAVVVGLFLSDLLEEKFRNPSSVAVMLVVVAVYFVFAEFIRHKKPSVKLGWKQVLLVGAAQAAALIPGVSRSGATIATGLLTGLKREEAARFSFLLGSVAITAATVLSVYKVAKGDFFLPSLDIVAVGIVSSFGAGFAAIAVLMRFLKKHTLLVFAAYRILLGVSILMLL